MNEYEEIVQPTLVSARQCEGVPKDQAFFTATSENQATEAYRIWLRLLDATRNGAKLALECNLAPTKKGKSCARVIAALKADELTDVEDCDSASYETVCHKLYARDLAITVATRAHIFPGPPPGEIISTKVDTLVILADTIMD